MTYSHDEMRARVIEALARCLVRNADEIRGSDTLVERLGLDSLDFLDLMFTLEKTFQTRIRDADFDRLLKPTQDEALPADLSPAEVQAMSRFIPALEQKAHDGGIPRNSVISLMTVDALVSMITCKLEQSEKR